MAKGGSKSPDMAAFAAHIITSANGGIAFFGWGSAKSIAEQETAARTKLTAIQSVVDRGYILYARASEREFIDLVANSPGIELTGPTAEYVKASIREDWASLDVLEKEVQEANRLPIKHLMDGYLLLVDGKCEEAIPKLEQYTKEVSVKFLLLASAHQRCGNSQKAIELNNKVRDMPTTRPGDKIKAKALHNNGHAALKNGRAQEAIEYFKLALKADSTLYGVNYNYAAAYSELGDQKAAIARLCEYSRLHDGSVIDEIETDPDKFFGQLRTHLGHDWKTSLRKQLEVPKCAA